MMDRQVQGRCGGLRRLLVAVALALGLATAATLLAACGGDDDETADTGRTTVVAVEGISPEGTWAYPNANLANTRQTTGPIDVATLNQLGVAWTLPIRASGELGGFSATPIVVDGTVYAQDMSSNVHAVDLGSGEVRWERAYDSPANGPNGVTVGDGRVYGATADSAFALDQATGDELWRVRLTRNGSEGIDMAPGYADGIVYVSTVPGNARSSDRGDGVGVLWALDGADGRRLWRFDTAPQDLWAPDHRAINSGGGLRSPPAFDGEGKLFVAIAGPGPAPGTAQYPWGSSRPGPNLLTNSLVKLDAASGDVDWYQQVLPHDIYGWELQLPPILTEHDGRPIALAAGKLGYVFAFDAENGDKLWERQVGIHNGHDSDNRLAMERRFERLDTPETVWPGVRGGVQTPMALRGDTLYAPVVNLPTRFTSQETRSVDLGGGTGEMVALDVGDGDVKWRRRFPTPPYGAATVANSLVFTTTLDGTIYALDADTGEIVWRERLPGATTAPIAIAGDTLVTAARAPQGAAQPAQLIAYRIGAAGRRARPAPQPAETAPAQPPPERPAPALAGGREVFTTNCAPCHTLADAGTSGTIGPNLDDLRPDAETAREQVINGGGGMPAFGDRLTPQEIEAVSQYVASVAGGGG